MDLPRASTPISLVNIKEFSMLNIPAIFDFDKDDEIGLQPNKRPIKTIETKDEKIITNSVKLKPKAINNNDFDDTL